MVRNAILVTALGLAAAGCAHAFAGPPLTGEPSASIADTSGLTGHWQGTMYETAGSLVSGSSPVDLTIAPDGTWRGTIARAPATGTAERRGNRVVLNGTAAAPGGPARPVYLDLRTRGNDMWGETVATFGGRDGRASVSLDRVQS
jgi:hypothetical protein